MTDGKIIPLRAESAPSIPLGERDDDALMLLASAGRTDAFATLVTRYAPRLTGFCIKLACDQRLGEDLAQESWLQVWAARSSYRPDGRFKVYLYTVARNRVRNQARDRARRGRWLTPADPTLDAADASPGHLDVLIERERQRRTLEAIGRLPATLREALLLRVSEGLGYPDIARIIDRTESAARSRVHLAIEQLRHELNAKGAP